MAAVLEQQPGAQPVKSEFQIALTVDEAIRRQILEGEGLVAVAEACTVDCADMAQLAQQNLNAAIAFRNELTARRDRLIAPALAIIDEAKGQFNPGISSASKAEQLYRQKLAGFHAEQKRLVDEAKRKAEEEARRQREEAERQAAAARARAEAQAAESRRLAEEAAARERKAREEGNARAAAAAAAERAKREEEERQRREAGEREADRLQMEAAARAQAAPAPAAAVGVGGSRETWAAALADDLKGLDDEARELEALERIVAAIAGVEKLGARRDLLAGLRLHMPTFNRMASTQKRLFNVPGLKAVQSTGFVNRKSSKGG